jgi:hypothetical protein
VSALAGASALASLFALAAAVLLHTPGTRKSSGA